MTSQPSHSRRTTNGKTDENRRRKTSTHRLVKNFTFMSRIRWSSIKSAGGWGLTRGTTDESASSNATFFFFRMTTANSVLHCWRCKKCEKIKSQRIRKITVRLTTSDPSGSTANVLQLRGPKGPYVVHKYLSPSATTAGSFSLFVAVNGIGSENYDECRPAVFNTMRLALVTGGLAREDGEKNLPGPVNCEI